MTRPGEGRRRTRGEQLGVDETLPVIHVVGLGPGDIQSLPLQTYELLRSGRPVFLRTAVHPVVDALREDGVAFQSFDALYETEAEFRDVYRLIAEQLLDFARREDEIVYAVPGHPLMAEQSVQNLLQASPDDVSIQIGPGQSFVDPVCTALRVDPIQGLLLLDGTDLSAHQLSPGLNTLIAQVFHPRVAGDVKLTLMEVYPDEYPVVVIRAAGVADGERIERVPLYEIDRLEWIDHLTTVFVPAAGEREQQRDAWHAARLVKRLRAPGGCPWDRKQTHASLRPYVIEEAYEVADAIDTGDVDKLADELGDLYLQILLHAEIASETGDFSLRDVFAKLSDKLIRRHPHVFGEARARTVADAKALWKAQKALESSVEEGVTNGGTSGEPEGRGGQRALADVRWGRPPAHVAMELQNKAAQVGFDWERFDDVLDKLREEVEELTTAFSASAVDRQHVEDELSDVLFTVVNVVRWLELDVDTVLARGNRKFAARFEFVEQKVVQSGHEWHELSADTLDQYWNDAKIVSRTEV